MEKNFNNAPFICENPDPVKIPTLSEEQIEQIRKELDEFTTSTIDTTKYCPDCNVKMKPFGNSGWWFCPKCGQASATHAGDPPQQIEVPTTVLAKGWAKAVFPIETALFGKYYPDPDTIVIGNCSKLKVEHNGIEMEFPLNDHILESLNTIKINGFKYVKESK